jgi:hypothetical protein
MKLTSTSPVRPSTARKVVRMATAAISSGTRARKEPNTKASTTRAPRPPARVSTSTPVPAGSVAAAVRSASRPVTWTSVPAGRARRSPSPSASAMAGSPPSGPWKGPETSP